MPQSSFDAGLTDQVRHQLRMATPLLAALQDLKRMKRAGKPGTLAERAFLDGWRQFAKGEDPEDVGVLMVQRALIDNQLAGLDPDELADAGLGQEAIMRIGRSAMAQSLEGTFEGHPAADRLVGPRSSEGEVPAFARLLAEQPRAGATDPEAGRLYLHPPESHAEHSWGVAVYGVLLAEAFEADAGVVLTAALSHHLHNAYLPDGGFAGETLLEPDLAKVMAGFRAKALADLPADVGERVEQALSVIEGPPSPEAEAFHSADVLDRVLDVAWRARAADFSLRVATDDYGLVHEGPHKAFHDEVLDAAGIAP